MGQFAYIGAVIVFLFLFLFLPDRCPNCWARKWETLIGGRGGERCQKCGYVRGEMSEEEYRKKHFYSPTPEEWERLSKNPLKEIQEYMKKIQG